MTAENVEPAKDILGEVLNHGFVIADTTLNDQDLLGKLSELQHDLTIVFRVLQELANDPLGRFFLVWLLDSKSKIECMA